MVHWLSSSIFPCSSVRPSRYGDIRPSLHFFQYTQAQTHCTNPVPLNTNRYQVFLTQYQVRLTQYYQVPASTAPYWPSTTFYWPNNIIYQPFLLLTDPVTSYQPVVPHTDPVPSGINQYRPLVTIKTSDTLWKTSFLHILFSKSDCQTFFCRPEMSTVVR